MRERQNLHIYDTVIIGGGPAGYSAALYAARAGLDTLVVEKMTAGGQMALTDVIDNYPGFDDGIDGFTLGMKMQAGAERFGASTEYAEVLSVELSGHLKRLTTSSGTLTSRTVIIATGAVPRKLGISGEAELFGHGVHYCAHCDGRFYKGKTVAVVGGGNSAVTDALYLSRLAKKVFLIHRRDALRADRIYQNLALTTENIEIMRSSQVAEIVYDKALKAIKIQSTVSGQKTELYTDGLFVSIGREPASKLFGTLLSLDSAGYIIADESTKTEIEGVYAVGDVRTKALRQIVTAVADGATAIHFAEKYIADIQKDERI